MPTGKLPSEGKKLWEEVYQKAKKGSCKDAKDVEQCAAGSAWTAVKNAGWKEDKDGNWSKKAQLQEFSLVISKAAFDKSSSDPSKKRSWAMVASDTDADSYNDSMSLELFADFINRAKTNEQIPEEFRSDFWSGGMPYLSISHYPDLNGDAVPGSVSEIYVDGNRFKAKGYYSDTPLGRACFDAVCKDLYNPDRADADDKVRVSIAFLDYKHRHKSNDFVFERSTMEDTCPECLKELIGQMLTGEMPQGKEFLKGHLIHLAHTRVPVNTRTSLEVEKSMTTRKEDAASIVGDELAEKIEEEAKLVGKSAAVVIKSEEETPQEEVKEPEVAPVVEESKTEKSVDEEDTKEDEEEEKTKDASKKKAELVESSIVAHPLDTVLGEFKAAYDLVSKSNGTVEDKLTQLQSNYQHLADVIRESLTPPMTPELAQATAMDAMLSKFASVMESLIQRMELVATKMTTSYQPPISNTQTIQAQPVQRSITPAQIASSYPRPTPNPLGMKIQDFVNKTT